MKIFKLWINFLCRPICTRKTIVVFFFVFPPAQFLLTTNEIPQPCRAEHRVTFPAKVHTILKRVQSLIPTVRINAPVRPRKKKQHNPVQTFMSFLGVASPHNRLGSLFPAWRTEQESAFAGASFARNGHPVGRRNRVVVKILMA